MLVTVLPSHLGRGVMTLPGRIGCDAVLMPSPVSDDTVESDLDETRL
jgi:hypothetical protein